METNITAQQLTMAEAFPRSPARHAPAVKRGSSTNSRRGIQRKSRLPAGGRGGEHHGLRGGAAPPSGGVQSLLEPKKRQTGWDSPISHSQRAKRPMPHKTRAHDVHHMQNTNTPTPTRVSLAHTSELGPARGPLRSLPLGPGRHPSARHRPECRGGVK